MTDIYPNQDEPDFVNDDGVKWWHDRPLTLYAMRQGLIGCRAWIVEKPDGYRARLLTKSSDIIAEAQSLDAIGTKIDMLIALSKMNESE